MNVLDWLLVVLVAAYALSGYWQGFITGAFATAGLLLGGLFGVWLAPKALGNANPSMWVSLGALFIVILAASLGQGILQYAGARVRDRIRWRPVRFVDAVGGAIALYVDDNNRNRALIGWTVAAAANAGCAFGLMPAKNAESVVRNKFLPDDIVDCVSEMSNVLSSALEKGDNPHVKLQQVYSPAAMAPYEIAKLMYEHFERMDFEMDVPGYGSGRLAVSMRV